MRRYTALLFLLIALGHNSVKAQVTITSVQVTQNQGTNGLLEIKYDLTDLDDFFSTSDPTAWEAFVYDYNAIDVMAEFVSPSGKKYVISGFFMAKHPFLEENNCEFMNSIRIDDGGGNSHLERDPNGSITPKYTPTSITYRENSFSVFTSEFNGDGDFNTTSTDFVLGWYFRFSPNEVGVWNVTIFGNLDNGTSQQILTPYTDQITVEHFRDDSYSEINAFSNQIHVPGSEGVNFQGINYANDFYVSNSSKPNMIDEHTNPPDKKKGGVCSYIEAINSASDQGINVFRISPNSWYQGHPAGQMTALLKTNPKFSNELEFLQSNLGRWDYVFEYGRTKGVYFKFSFLQGAAFSNDLNTEAHPLSRFAEEPCSFFQWNDPTTAAYLRSYIKYIVARYGYSQAIIAWELMDEPEYVRTDLSVNKVDGPCTTAPECGELPCLECFSCFTTSSFTNQNFFIKEWYTEFSKMLKEEDLYRHLIAPGGFVAFYGLDPVLKADILSLPTLDFFDWQRGGFGTVLDINNVCDPIPHVPAGEKYSTVPRDLFGDAQSTYKPFNYNSWWGNDAHTFQSVPPTVEGIHLHDKQYLKGLFFHDPLLLGYFSNTLLGACHFYGYQSLTQYLSTTESYYPTSNGFTLSYGSHSQVGFLNDIKQGIGAEVGTNNYSTLNTVDVAHQSEIGVTINCTPTMLTEVDVFALHRNKKHFIGFVKPQKYYHEFYTQSCSSFFQNPPSNNVVFPWNGSTPRLYVKLSDEFQNVLVRIRWYRPEYITTIGGPDEVNLVFDSESSPTCINGLMAYFTFPYVGNCYGEIYFEIYAENAGDYNKNLDCQNITDEIFTLDYNGDGVDEILFVNKCEKKENLFMVKDQANNILYTEGNTSEKMRGFFDPEDEIYVGDFDKSRAGEEVLFLNKSLINKSEFTFVLRDLNHASTKKIAHSIRVLDADFKDNFADGITLKGNFDEDEELEILYVNKNANPGESFLMVISPSSNNPVEYSRTLPMSWTFMSEFFDDGGRDNLLVGDFNNDGVDDILFKNVYGQNEQALVVYDIFNASSITVLNHHVYQFLPGWIDYCDRLVVGDFVSGNGDELMFINTDNGGNMNQGAFLVYNVHTASIVRTFSSVQNYVSFFQNTDLIIGSDLDGDGIDELVLSNIDEPDATFGKGLTSIQFNTATPSVVCDFHKGSNGTAHVGWLDQNDFLLPIQVSSGNNHNLLTVNRPYYSGQNLFRSYDLSTSATNIPWSPAQQTTDADFLNGGYTYNCQGVTKENNTIIGVASKIKVPVDDFSEKEIGDLLDLAESQSIRDTSANKAIISGEMVNQTEDDYFEVYPNPNYTGNVTVHYSLQEPVESIVILTSLGQEMSRTEVENQSGEGRVEIPIAGASGTYTVILYTTKGTRYVRLLVVL